MFSKYFFHGTLEYISNCFGTLFNDIYIVREDDGSEIERIKVPISYGSKEKYFIKNKQDEDLHKQVAIELPRMSYKRLNIQYDPIRKLNQVHKTYKDIEHEKRFTQFTPVPYNIEYELVILTKNQIDGDQIVEQILPFFTPAFDISIKPIPDMDFIEDVAVELRNVENDDLSDSDFINRRVFEWRLTFVVRANFYGPVREQGVIKKSIIDIGIVEGDDEITREVMAKTPRVQRFTAVPNPLDTIPDENGEFGVSETFQEFHDGKKFDPETGEDVDI